MHYWLMKSEPEAYSWPDLVKDKVTEWNGVRNNMATLNLKAMAVGDRAFFYHSMSDKAIVAIMEITRTAKSDGKEGERWVSVEVKPVEALARPVTLAEVKADPRLADFELVRQSRLSVAKVKPEEWKIVLEMAGTPAA